MQHCPLRSQGSGWGGPAEPRRLAEGWSRSGKESRVIRSSVTESRAFARIASLAAQQRWSAESPISVEKHLQTQVTCPEQTRDKQSVASLAHVTSSLVIQLRCRSLITVALLLRCLAWLLQTRLPPPCDLSADCCATNQPIRSAPYTASRGST